MRLTNQLVWTLALLFGHATERATCFSHVGLAAMARALPIQRGTLSKRRSKRPERWAQEPGRSDSELNDDELADIIESNKPSDFTVMKEILGINIFTYILCALIVFFFSLNVAFGPGWLGQQIGLEGTGSFTEYSDNVPEAIDLSKPEYLLW